MKVFALLLMSFVSVLGEYVDVTCTADYCKTYVEETSCPVLPNICTAEYFAQNPSAGVLLPSPTLCNCCDYCITYLGAGASCSKGGTSGSITLKTICGPELTCGSDNKCVRLLTDCTQAQDDWDAMRLNGSLGYRMLRPECDKEGNFIPAHCVPGFSCYCVDPNGERLFGEATYDSPNTPYTLKCPCSVSGWRAKEAFAGSTQKVIVSRCLADGRFESLQCVDNKCFCVNPDDGSLLGNSYVHIADLTEDSLSCFDPNMHQEHKYMKPCEEEKYNVEQELSLLMLDGLLGLGLKPPSCDADGTYSKLQELGNKYVCVDSENNLIENFSANKTSTAALDMDCNCARTRLVLQDMVDDGHLVELPTCCSNGNFERWQCQRGICYCVDVNGNQEFVEQTIDNVNRLTCFDLSGPCALYGLL